MNQRHPSGAREVDIVENCMALFSVDGGGLLAELSTMVTAQPVV